MQVGIELPVETTDTAVALKKASTRGARGLLPSGWRFVQAIENNMTRPAGSDADGCSVHANRGQDKQTTLSGVKLLALGKPNRDTCEAQLQFERIADAEDAVCTR